MPTNNFKLFDEKKANMMSDEEYAINQQRLNGVQSGVASSQLQNKTLYQTALMCYALAQLMAANGYDANDADAVSTFVNNLSMSVLQKAVDKASAADITNKVANKWVDAKQLGELKTDVADNYLSLLGGTMLGDLILHSDPTQSLQAATKQYVDGKRRFKFGTYTGNGNTRTKVTQTIDVGFDIELLFVFIVKDFIRNLGNGDALDSDIVSLFKGNTLSTTSFTKFVCLSISGTSFSVVSDYNENAWYGLNTLNLKYGYLAFGSLD